MSWPLLITTIANSMVGMTDLYVAGYLGSQYQAAVGLGEQIIFMFLLFVMATGTGTTAIVSRYWGEGTEDARKQAFSYTAQSLVMALCLGIFLAAISYFGAHFVLSPFTKSAEVTQLATNYLGIFSLYMIPFSVLCICNAAFRAIGDAKTPLLIVGTFTVLTITGDFLTVLHNWPVADLGIRGIAFSALTASTVASLLALFKLSRSPLSPSLRELNKVVPEMIKKIAKIGIPSAFQRLAWASSTFVLFFILAHLKNPTEALASWAVGMRVEGLMFMPVMALSMAVSSIVGQNLGAKQVERAYQAGWKVAGVGIALLTILATGLFLLASPIAHFMCNNEDTQTIKFVISYLQINALSEPFLALGMILGGAFQGASDTKTPMWITFITNWIIRLPLAYFLALHLNMGPEGAWWAMTTSVVIMGFITAWRFQTRSWTRIHL